MVSVKPTVNPLEDLYALIDQGKIEKDITIVRGPITKVFRFRSLFDEDYNWRDRFVSIDTQLAMSASLRAPTLAIATVAIDGVPVDNLEGMADIDPTLPQVIRDVMVQDIKYVIAYNLYSKVYEKLPRDVVIELYNKYIEEVEKVARTVNGEAVKNS